MHRVVGIFLVGFICLLTIFVLFGGVGEGKTITVDDDGGKADYTRIQDAINACDDGDTIRVWEGEYTERLDINISITLIGNGSASTILVTPGDQYHVIIESERVNLTGFHFRGIFGFADGIFLWSNQSRIVQNVFSNYSKGLIIDHTSNATIENNSFIRHLSNTIYSYNSTNNRFVNNSVSNNLEIGLSLYNSHNNTIQGNQFHENGKKGLYLHSSMSNYIIENNFTNNYEGIYFHI